MDATGGMDISSIRVIGAAVTPTVMVSACGILATGLDNQIARMTARTRDMLKEWRSLPEDNPRREVLRMEVAILDRRHGLLARALGDGLRGAHLVRGDVAAVPVAAALRRAGRAAGVGGSDSPLPLHQYAARKWALSLL